MHLGVVREVHAVMVELRLREAQQFRTDSARLAQAIRTIAARRRVRYSEVENDLDEALAYRR